MINLVIPYLMLSLLYGFIKIIFGSFTNKKISVFLSKNTFTTY